MSFFTAGNKVEQISEHEPTKVVGIKKQKRVLGTSTELVMILCCVYTHVFYVVALMEILKDCVK